MKTLVDLPGCVVDKVSTADGQVVFEAHKRTKYERCPDCGRRSCSIHSSYCRHPDDLPLCKHRLELCLCVRRFRCLNPQCQRCTFAEPFPDLVLRHAQRTSRLREVQSWVGLSTGGEGGCALLGKLRMPTSPDTVLRLIRALPLPAMATPQVLGVDDWSFKRGKRFGTILVDLEKHQVVDLLPDRTAQTLSTWLKQHPGIQVISRDRSTEYATAATEGAPQAIQVADRWHLLKNLGEILKYWLERHRAVLNKLTQAVTPTHIENTLRVTERARACKALYLQAVELLERGFTVQGAARKVGIPRQTLDRWLRKGSPTFGKKTRLHLAEFVPYLKQRRAEGITNTLQLHREIVSQGFRGSYATLYVFFAALEAGLAQEGTRPKISSASITATTADTAAATPSTASTKTTSAYSLFERQRIFSIPTEKLDPEQKRWLDEVLRSIPQATKVRELVQGFANLLSKNIAEPVTQFQTWLRSAEEAGIHEFKRLANGLHQDLKAVEAALTLPWSNGQVEGQVNKLKLIKRMMFGRANFDLLRRRVILASVH